jgi:hypothetical protein
MNEPDRLSAFIDRESIDPTLRSYYNARVHIYYREAQYSDQGRITYMDSDWTELKKANGERLLIPNSSIRIIKLIEPSEKEVEANYLLRPAEGNVSPPRLESRKDNKRNE